VKIESEVKGEKRKKKKERRKKDETWL